MRRALFLCAVLAIGCGGAASEVHETRTVPVATAETEGAPIESEIVSTNGVVVGAMPVAVTSFGAAVIGDDVYVAGGYHGEPHRYTREGQSRSFARMSADGTWTELAPLDTGLQGLALAVVDGALVRCGGSRVDNAEGEPTSMHSIATCARFEHDAWSPMPDMPEPRSSFDVAALDGRIYAIGGWNVDGDSDHATFATTMLVYDAGAWRAVPSPVTRRALAVVATTHAIVAIGGLRPDISASGEVDVFDPGSGAWSHGPELPGDGFGVAATAIGDDVYASGSDGVVRHWHVGDASWSELGTLAQPRFFHRLVARGDALLAIGGIGSMTTDGRARWIEGFSIARDGAPRVGWIEISFPGEARNRFGLFAHEDSLYVFGGNDSTEQHDFARENFVSQAFRLHLPSLRWFAIDALPEARQSLESVVVGESAIAIGGFGHDEDAPRTFADAFVLDEGHWRMQRDALPSPRTQFGLAEHDGALWVFAGLAYDTALPEEERFTHLATVLRCPLDGTTIGTCEEVGSLPGTRRAFAGAALGDRYYVVGGMRDGFAPIEDCAVFDFASRTSAAFVCPSHVRISASMIAMNDRLYLVGGSTGGPGGLAPDRSIEVFDPAASTWSTSIEQLPFDTHQARWTLVHDRIVMIDTQHEASRATIAFIDVN